MNRYTLKAQCLDHSVAEMEIKSALDDLFRQTMPKVKYRLNRIHKMNSGIVLVEIASSANKDLLESRLKALDSRLPIRVEALGWGWVAGSKPHAVTEAIPMTFQLGTIWDLVRYALLLIFTAAEIALPFLKPWIKNQKSLVDLTFFAIFAILAIWMFLSNNTPLDFRLFAKQADCLPAELVLTYRFRMKPVHLKWEDICGLKIEGHNCILTTNQRKSRFYISSILKIHNMNRFIKTIAQQAALNEVNYEIGQELYKRYDAP